MSQTPVNTTDQRPVVISVTNSRTGHKLELIELELENAEEIIFALINRTTGEVREQGVPRAIAQARGGYDKRASKRMRAQSPDTMVPWTLVK
jgi:hypothetical protein